MPAPILVFLLLMGTLVGQQRQPNIIWLTVEDMSPWLTCYGDATVLTPNIDRLAERSTRYTHAYSNAPVCAPARATLITGCYATSIGAHNMRTVNQSKASLHRDPNAYDNIPQYEAVPPAEVRCFPELLREQGYFCTNNSKKDYQFIEPKTVWNLSGRKAHWRKRPDPNQPFFAVFNYTGTHESGTFPQTPRKPKVVDPADVTLPPYYPDTPTVREDVARTYDNIAAMDAWVGRHLDQLKEDGLEENTIVFFFSDHGVGLPRGKRNLYDSGTRVPLLISKPGQQKGIDHRLVSFVDFAPTVLSLANESAPPWMMGSAFAGSHKSADPEFVFLHADRMDASIDQSRGVVDGRYRYIQNFMPNRPHIYPVAYADSIPMTAEVKKLQEMIRPPKVSWQLAGTTKPSEELYDMESDPFEIHNLAQDQSLARVKARLRNALNSWRKESGDLGVLSEKDLVTDQLWKPEGVQPITTAPMVTLSEDGVIQFSCKTEGAAIGWRVSGEREWQLPTPAPQWTSNIQYEMFAHRIGFKPSEVVSISLKDKAIHFLRRGMARE
ncbi:MAG: sulfatase [Planctomycetes bacterium]|nr:sulfatase [Planctomycetota bacterium]